MNRSNQKDQISGGRITENGERVVTDRRDEADLARAQDFQGHISHNAPPDPQWVSGEGTISEPIGADSSPTQHFKANMHRVNSTGGEAEFRCPECGATATLNAQEVQGKQVWCDGVNMAIE